MINKKSLVSPVLSITLSLSTLPALAVNQLGERVSILELESKQELLEDEIMKYRLLANEKIITEEEFSVKEEELLFFIKKNI